MACGMIYGHTAYGWDAGYPVAGNPQLGLVMEPGRLNPLVLPANENIENNSFWNCPTALIIATNRIDYCNLPFLVSPFTNLN